MNDELCRWCGRRPATDGHHLFPRAQAPDMVEDPDNIVKLCRWCHEKCTKSKEVEVMFREYFFMKPERVLTVEVVSQSMRDEEMISPRDIDRYTRYLAAQYAYQSTEYTKLKSKMALTWLTIRQEYGSDKQAQAWFDATEDGQKMMLLKAYLKMLEKMMSALKSAAYIQSQEAKNMY